MKNIINALLLVAGFTLVAAPVVTAETLTNNPTETTGQVFDSTKVTAAVKAKLLTTKGIDSNDITVTSESAGKNGVIVILEGKQKTQALVNKAGLIAKRTKGVAKVMNNLKVVSDSQPADSKTLTNNSTETTGQAFDSAKVTAAVKTKLLTTTGIDSNDITVTSESVGKDGVIVILEGKQKSQALVNNAGLVAKSTKGVAKVINNLKVVND